MVSPLLGRSPALSVGFQLMKSNEEDCFEPKPDARIEIALKAASGELTAEEAEEALAERGLKGTLGSTIQYALDATRNVKLFVQRLRTLARDDQSA